MDSDNSSDQFLTIQSLNPISGGVVSLSPPSSGIAPVNFHELSTTNSSMGPNSSTLIGR